MVNKFDKELFTYQCDRIKQKIEAKRTVDELMILRFSTSILQILQENISDDELPKEFYSLVNYINDWYWYCLNENNEDSKEITVQYCQIYTLSHMVVLRKNNAEYWEGIKDFYIKYKDEKIVWETMEFLAANPGSDIDSVSIKMYSTVKLLNNADMINCYPITDRWTSISITNKGFDLLKYIKENKENERN